MYYGRVKVEGGVSHVCISPLSYGPVILSKGECDVEVTMYS